MNTLQNLHTHSTFCDGKDTPEEMILNAINQSFGSIGFSGHSYMYYSPTFATGMKDTTEYKNEITRLKEKYKDKIDIFLGLEYDMYSDVPHDGYDYLIGALHYLKIGDKHVEFDRSADEVQTVIGKYFGGDGIAFAKKYYQELATLPDYGDFDIIGHIDIITKNIEIIPFFDMYSKEYINAAVEAMEALQGKIPFFEMNTGAISRCYRTTPYPTMPLLKELKRLGFGAIISSDCHDATKLTQSFDTCHEMLKEAGFGEKYILTPDGFRAVSI